MKRMKNKLALLLAVLMLPMLPACRKSDDAIYAITNLRQEYIGEEKFYEAYASYDENGRMEQRGSYLNGEDTLTAISYSEDGRRIYLSRETGQGSYQEEMRLDENLRLAEYIFAKTVNGEAQESSRYLYTYDADGNLLSKTWYVGEEEHQLESYTYEDGTCRRMVTKIYSSEPGYPGSQWIREYNEKGDLTLYRHYDEQGSLTEGRDIVNTYDSNGNLIRTESTSVTFDADPSVVTYTYDDQNRLTGKEGDSSIRYTYDRKGRLVTECVTYHGANAVTRETQYTYDEYGNLTCKEHIKTYTSGEQTAWKETIAYTRLELSDEDRARYELLKLEGIDLSPFTDRLQEIGPI